MDERKKVRVTINQDDSKDHRSHDLEKVLTPKSKGIHNFSGKKKFSVTILRAVILAVALGTLFGFAMMYFFDLSTDQTPVGTPVETIGTQDDDGEEGTNGGTSDQGDSTVFQTDLSTHEVIQLGVFSSEQNARELQLHLDFVPSVVTEDNGQYVLLTSLLRSSSVEEEVMNYFESNGLERNEDYISKTWAFSSEEVEVPDGVYEWLNQGEELIHETELNGEWRDRVEDWLSQLPNHYSDHNYLDEAINIITDQPSNESEQLLQNQTLLLAIYLFYDVI
ncbi:hypothetical protein [Alkalibacillus haloalkaliphilus]|uniref:SPOR domain-containing protein n=1 Tax=Alkalibacillus haloalkaliphilus TaxID=94136 RepID=A0A511W406_9BACI|nr:hypothetical protein [Alkalibacillus haloalkaliphilus]GEN45810.1 hypothetical protein AHA02nite_15860 [Alkalibacillus haloalkaliphilus]